MDKRLTAAYSANAMLVAANNEDADLLTHLIDEISDVDARWIIAHLTGMVLGMIQDTDRSVEEWLEKFGTATAAFEAESE